MEAIKVVRENSAVPFEKQCNELVEQGYILQSSACGFFNGEGGYTPMPYYYAVFALPQYTAQQSVHPTKGGQS